jgi:hypothetical protein
MVISLRGTSGSGKSTIVRKVMGTFQSKSPFFVEGRKQPFSYLLSDAQHPRPLRVVGHYEIPTGGCDTISSLDLVFPHVHSSVERGEDVIFEGIMMGDDVTRTVNLHRATDLLVIGLTTPIEICLAGVQARRDARGDDRPLDPKNTKSRAERLKRNFSRLKDAGVKTMWLSREEALDVCMKAFPMGVTR